MIRWIVSLDIIAREFLVDVDQDPPADRLGYSGALHFSWLEYNVAVGKDHGTPQAPSAPR